MTSIKLDDPAGSVAVRDLLENPPGDVIEFLGPSGEVLGTLFSQSIQASQQQYAELVAESEGGLDELLRLASTPIENCATTDEVLARAGAHGAG